MAYSYCSAPAALSFTWNNHSLQHKPKGGKARLCVPECGPSRWKEKHSHQVFIYLFPFQFQHYQKVSSETDLWPKSVAEIRWIRWASSRVTLFTVVWGQRPPPGRGLCPRSVPRIETWTHHMGGGGCKTHIYKKLLYIFIRFLESTKNDLLNP